MRDAPSPPFCIFRIILVAPEKVKKQLMKAYFGFNLLGYFNALFTYVSFFTLVGETRVEMRWVNLRLRRDRANMHLPLLRWCFGE